MKGKANHINNAGKKGSLCGMHMFGFAFHMHFYCL